MLNPSAPRVPIWRLVVYWLISIGIAAWVGHVMHEPHLIWVGVAAVPVLILMGLGVARLVRSAWLRRNLGWLIAVYAVLQLIRLLWHLFEKR